MFVPGKPFQPSLMFAGNARTLPRVEHLKVASLGWPLALPANIRLGWKGLPRTNKPSYYEYLLITVEKVSITLGLGLTFFIKRFKKFNILKGRP